VEDTQPAPARRTPGSRRRRIRVRGLATLLGRDHEVSAPVLRPAGLARFGADGTLLAVRDRLDPRAIDPQRGEIVLRGVGAPLPEREVVLVRAALVAMSLDQDLHRRKLL